MKVALLRCHGLRKYEIQSFEPLKDIIEIKAFSPWRHTYDLGEITLPVEKLPPVSKWRQNLRDIRNLLRGRDGNLYRKADFFLPQFEKRLCHFDIIHVNEISSKSSYVGAMLKKKYGMRLVSTVWENIPFFDRADKMSRFIFDIAYPMIDMFVAPTERGRAVLRLEGVPDEKIKVIYHGIDIERFTPSSSDLTLQRLLGIMPEHKVVLFAGRIVYKKGIYTLCQAIKEIKRLNPDMCLKVIVLGKGPEEMDLKKYIKELALEEEFILRGHISYQQMPLFYNLAHIFVLPSIPTHSWQEQFGFVLAEAMASQKAIITTLTGAIPEVVGEGAVLIPPDDYLALADSIIQLLKNDALRVSLGKRAREIAASRYNIQDSARKFLSLYEDILSI